MKSFGTFGLILLFIILFFSQFIPAQDKNFLPLQSGNKYQYCDNNKYWDLEINMDTIFTDLPDSIPQHPFSFYIQIRLESYFYFTNKMENSYVNLLPYNLFLKVGINYYQFGLDLGGGGLFGPEPFFGEEFGVSLRYRITEAISSHIVYLRHKNGNGDHMSYGEFTEPIHFLGFGAGAKFTKVFGLDLTVYIPVGNNKLEYSWDFNNTYRTMSKIDMLTKLSYFFEF